MRGPHYNSKSLLFRSVSRNNEPKGIPKEWMYTDKMRE